MSGRGRARQLGGTGSGESVGTGRGPDQPVALVGFGLDLDSLIKIGAIGRL